MNNHAERAAIGAALLWPEYQQRFAKALRTHFFQQDEAKKVADAIIKAANSGSTITAHSLSAPLALFASQCIEDAKSGREFDLAVKAIRDAYVSTELTRAASNAISQAGDGGDVRAVFERLGSEIEQVINELDGSIAYTSKTEEACSLAIEQLMRKIEGGKSTDFEWFLQCINYKVGGFDAGEYVLIKAKKGVGKTTFAIQQLLSAALSGHKAAFISIEMPAHLIASKMACILSGINSAFVRARTEALNANMVRAYEAGLQKLKEIGLDIYDDARSASAVIELISSLGRSGVKMISLDYAQIVNIPRAYGDTRQQRIAEFCNSLMAICKSFGITLLLLSQKNNDGMSREAEDLENAAGIVVNISRPDYEAKDNNPDGDFGRVLFKIEKNRHGEPWGTSWEVRFEEGQFVQVNSAGDNEYKLFSGIYCPAIHAIGIASNENPVF